MHRLCLDIFNFYKPPNFLRLNDSSLMRALFYNIFMPQLQAFYFVNQMTFMLIGLFTITYIMSVYVLPYFVQLFVTRVYITKL